jgi:hypothetical protein
VTRMMLQSGWGHTTRATRLAEQAVPVRGTILSPQHMSPERLSEAALSDFGRPILLDPQTYVHSIVDGTASRHEDHGLASELEWDASASAIQSVAQSVIDANAALGLDDLQIAPAPLMSGFQDSWSQLGSSLLSTYIEASPAPVLATVAFDLQAIASWEEVEAWLDLFTRRDIEGVYLIVCNEAPYPPPWDANLLAGILRLIYRLSELNGYRVVWGYSDIPGLLGLTVGAESMSSGWFYGSRRFSRSSWVPSSGGRPPTPRVLLPELLQPVRSDSLSAAWGAAGAYSGLSRGDIDALNRNEWTGELSWTQHLRQLSRSSMEFAAGDLDARLDHAEAALAGASTVLDRLAGSGIAVETGLRSRVEELRRALQLFANEEL